MSAVCYVCTVFAHTQLQPGPPSEQCPHLLLCCLVLCLGGWVGSGQGGGSSQPIVGLGSWAVQTWTATNVGTDGAEGLFSCQGQVGVCMVGRGSYPQFGKKRGLLSCQCTHRRLRINAAYDFKAQRLKRVPGKLAPYGPGHEEKSLCQGPAPPDLVPPGLRQTAPSVGSMPLGLPVSPPPFHIDSACSWVQPLPGAEGLIPVQPPSDERVKSCLGG